ncbi:MAG: hypothetical protein QNJ34_12755 [Xenococcaceae cyanobacterium MO_188.B29]|nr:hypothetical protein [Xenococcaceae cyanobacterium MO_188.B29]
MSSLSPDRPIAENSSDFELELLKEEYFFVQSTIEDYNKPRG